MTKTGRGWAEYWRKLIRFSMCLALLCSIGQCYSAQPSDQAYTKDGKEYGKVKGAFRGEWWNYFERGASYMEGEYFEEAVSDFKNAIKKKGQDRRNANTYGYHYIDYFPHRELGLVYYKLGKLESAEKELEISWKSYPTAKTKYFLNQVRKAIIRQRKKKKTTPKVTFDFKTGEVWTQGDPLDFSGKAEDEQYIASINIKGDPLFLEIPEKQVHFKKLLYLSQGKQAIDVEAKNLAGEKAVYHMTIHVDREGPVINIDDLQFDQSPGNKNVTIAGSLFDKAGVSDFSINGAKVPIKQDVTVRFKENFMLDNGHIHLVTRDRLGNETTARIPLSVFTSRHVSVLLASTDFLAVNMADIKKDTKPPDIWIKTSYDKWIKGSVAVTKPLSKEKILIVIQVTDNNKIERISINQKPVRRKVSKVIIFTYEAELIQGENIIIIKAVDEHGNVKTERITFFRQEPIIPLLPDRLGFSVFCFGQNSENGEYFKNSLINALARENRFQQPSPDARCNIKGYIAETRSGIEIVGRVFDKEISEMLATVDVFNVSDDPVILKLLAEEMVTKLNREFPLLPGEVFKCVEKQIFVRYVHDKLKPNRRLIVYLEKPLEDPRTGNPIDMDYETIGYARIIQKLKKTTKAEMIDYEPGLVKPGDKIITE